MSYRMILARFAKVVNTMDLRPASSTVAARAAAYARKNKTCGKRAVYAPGKDVVCPWSLPGMAR